MSKNVFCFITLFITGCAITNGGHSNHIPQYKELSFSLMENLAMLNWMEKGNDIDKLVRLYIDSDERIQERRNVAIKAYGTSVDFDETLKKNILNNLSKFKSEYDFNSTYEVTSRLKLNFELYDNKNGFFKFNELFFTISSPKKIKYNSDRFNQISWVDKNMSYTKANFVADFNNFVFYSPPELVEFNLLKYGSNSKLFLETTSHFNVESCSFTSPEYSDGSIGKYKILCNTKLKDVFYFFKEDIHETQFITSKSKPTGKLKRLMH